MKKKTLQRSHGQIAVLITLVSVVILIGLNIIVFLMDSRYGLQLDLSEEKRYQLSDVSEEALSSSDTPVEIYMLSDESTMETGNSYTTLVYYLLKQYPRRFPNISLSFVDLVETPSFAARFPQYDLKTYDTVISCGEKNRRIGINDMFSYESDGYSSSVRGSIAEQTITNGILAVSTSTHLNVVCLDGYSGTSPDVFLSLLSSGGASVSHSSLITENIDPEADIALFYDLRNDPDQISLAKLDRWLSNDGAQGKRLMIFLNPYHHLLPNLTAFLKDWNLSIGDGLVVDTTAGNYYSVPYCPIPETVSASLLTENGTKQAPAAFMLCSPVSAEDPADDRHLIEELVVFSKNAAILPLDAKSEEDAVPTAYPAGLIRSDSVPSSSTGLVSDIVLSGSCEAVSAEILTSSSFSNYALFRSLCAGKGALAPTVQVPEKNMKEASLAIPRQTVILCIVVFLVLIPLAVLIAGILIWRKRILG